MLPVIENARDIGCRQASPKSDRQSQAGKLVDDGRALELTAVVHLITDKAVAPDVVGVLRPVHPLCRRAEELALAALVHHLQALAAPPFCQAHHFRLFTSFSMRMSRACSATTFFSCAFSRSRSLSRLASDTFMPPYFACQR